MPNKKALPHSCKGCFGSCMAEAPLHHLSHPTTSTGSAACLCVQSPVPPVPGVLGFFHGHGASSLLCPHPCSPSRSCSAPAWHCPCPCGPRSLLPPAPILLPAHLEQCPAAVETLMGLWQEAAHLSFSSILPQIAPGLMRTAAEDAQPGSPAPAPQRSGAPPAPTQHALASLLCPPLLPPSLLPAGSSALFSLHALVPAGHRDVHQGVTVPSGRQGPLVPAGMAAGAVVTVCALPVPAERGGTVPLHLRYQAQCHEVLDPARSPQPR